MSGDRIDSFGDTLEALDAGQASAEVNRALRDILSRNVEISREHGKASASLTITLGLKTEGQNGKTEVTYKVAAKPAPVPRQSSVLYATDSGALSDHDPRQMRLPIKGRARTTDPTPKENA